MAAAEAEQPLPWMADRRVQRLLRSYEAADNRLRRAGLTAAELIDRCCPVLLMDSEDRFLPSSVEWYLERSAVTFGGVPLAERGSIKDFGELLRLPPFAQDQPAGGAGDAAVPEGAAGVIPGAVPKGPRKVLWPPDIRLQHHKVRRTDFRLRVDSQFRAGLPADRINAEAPLYADFRFNGELQVFEIRYIFFFPYNGWYKVLGMKKGQHDADVEHCTLRLDPESFRVQDVYFGRHGYQDGEWLNADRVHWEPDLRRAAEAGPGPGPGPAAADYGKGLRPVLYVARHFHGVYPRPGKFSRLRGLVSDVCDGKGPRWDPARVVDISLRPGRPCPPEAAWAYFSGKMGSEGVSAPVLQRWWFRECPDGYQPKQQPPRPPQKPQQPPPPQPAAAEPGLSGDDNSDPDSDPDQDLLLAAAQL